MKGKKNTQIILFVVVGLVIVIALLIPYTTNNKNNKTEAVTVNTLTCDDDNPESEHDTTLNTITCSEYNDIINGDTKNVVLYARPTCSYCNKFVPVLEEIVEEYGIELNYFDIDTLSQDELKEFYSSSSLMTSSDFGTPALVIIKNGKIVDSSIGYTEKDTTVDWLEEKGIISE